MLALDSNENPLGPGPAAVEAIAAAFTDAGRYPMNAATTMADLRGRIGVRSGTRAESLVLGAGSGELLRAAVRAFTSGRRGLVTAAPSYEAPERLARQIGAPVAAVPVDAGGRIDLERMARAAAGAGLLFVCNPNNPTATVHSAAAIADLVARVRRESPDTTILLDEAYDEYVTDPACATAAPLALAHPRVLVTRTFSKAYGMAGLRIGWAIGRPDTVGALARYVMPHTVNVLGLAAARAAVEAPDFVEAERRRNADVRRFTTDFFRSAGFEVTDSQTNFVFVNLRRPAREFRDGCLALGVRVGRDFHPLERTHCRISLGTADEMRQAAEVFARVLGVGRGAHAH